MSYWDTIPDRWAKPAPKAAAPKTQTTWWSPQPKPTANKWQNANPFGKPVNWQGVVKNVSNAAQTFFKDVTRNNNNATAIVNRYGAQQPGTQNPWQRKPETKGIFGVDYGPNWKRGTYTPPVTYRQDNPGIQMNQQEYMLRRNAWNKMYQPGYDAWVNKAAQTPNQPHWLGSDWANKNPQPSGFLQTNQEWTVRNNAAPTGYTYVPFGSSYVKNPTLPASSGASTNTPSGAGGYGGYGGYGGGWGGGGGGYSGYSGGGYEDTRNWYNQMVQWNIGR
jgi:hypothetical protein